MKRKMAFYSIPVIYLVVTCIVATVKAFIGGGAFFIVMAIVTFVAACLYAFIAYKAVSE